MPIDNTPWTAYCWASGLIQFGNSVPECAILVATGPRTHLENIVSAAARHGYTKGELLVPGVPEANSKRKAVDALSDWVKWRASFNGKKSSLGVVFNTKKG